MAAASGFKRKKQEKRDTACKLILPLHDRFSAQGILCIPTARFVDPAIQKKLAIECQRLLPRDKYVDKHLPQEIAIIHQLASMIPEIERKMSLVIDIGGGNGDLAYLISQILQVDVMVIDNHVPVTKIDDSPSADLSHFSRLVADVRDVSFTNDEKFSGKKLYLACKHLCGTSLDLVISHISSIKTDNIRGFVFAPCCYHKNKPLDFLKQDLLSESDFEAIRYFCDWKTAETFLAHTPDKKEQYSLGSIAQNIINSVRISLLNHTFSTNMIEFVPCTVTPKNILLIGSLRDPRK
ncbi:MAG: putative methyltransferase TRM13-like [Hyperionvirus sp.]|uniref:Putative methyltransferase TRM13-like n=1 Tax=Hyperionvirus sp. TaxID=2487770 RepID=A0A3G5ABG2_9VIRU|nr:MAG: putative methyltransferase TRM13-like [Hyperionvirus sp.]